LFHDLHDIRNLIHKTKLLMHVAGLDTYNAQPFISASAKRLRKYERILSASFMIPPLLRMSD